MSDKVVINMFPQSDNRGKPALVITVAKEPDSETMSATLVDTVSGSAITFDSKLEWKAIWDEIDAAIYYFANRTWDRKSRT